jgi:hypothetical protein
LEQWKVRAEKPGDEDEAAREDEDDPYGRYSDAASQSVRASVMEWHRRKALMDLSQAREIDDDAMNTRHASDARIALRTLDRLREKGYTPHTLTVGSVTIGLAMYVPPPAPEMLGHEDDANAEQPRPQRKSKPGPGIYEEHGADLLGQLEEERRDDDEG